MTTEKKPENPQAFPRPFSMAIHPGGDTMISQQDGMDLRDYFAAKAMQPLINIYASRSRYDQRHAIDWETKDGEPYMIAEYAYKMADAMLKERERQTP